MPDPITAAVVGGTTLVSGKMQADAAKKAAGTQAAAADRAMAQEREMYDISREDLAPYRETGYTALQDITKRMPLFTSQFGDEQMAQYLDPSMEFRRRLGEQTTARMLNVGGGAISGNTLRGLEDYGQNLASTEYGNAFNRFQNERTNIYNTLANIAGMGQQAVNTGVTAGQNFAGSQSGLITGQAAAQAAGQVGAANAYSGALGNIGNYAMLNSFLGKQAPGTAVQQTGQSSSGLFPMPSTQSASPYYSTPQSPSFSFSAP
jgi:hypothetical protein